MECKVLDRTHRVRHVTEKAVIALASCSFRKKDGTYEIADMKKNR
jgi:hypothetical protein